MQKSNYLLFLIIFTNLISCASNKKLANVEDPYIWLEEIESPKALEFAKSENQKTINTLQKDPHYKKIESEFREMAYSEDRIAWGSPRNGMYYNFWRDQKNPRGLWRRTSTKEYKKDKSKWETIINLDELSKKEDENWVWGGANCLIPDNNLCLISLSRGGKDAKVVREYDLANKNFVKDGFIIPEAKSRVSWINKDAVYVGTQYGEDSLTLSGYPRTIKYLERGKKLKDAPIMFEVDKKSLSASAYVEFTPLKNYHFFEEKFSFYQSENWYFENGVKHLLPFPKDAEFFGYFNQYLLIMIKSELKTPHKNFLAGSLLALPFSKLKDKSLDSIELVFEPTSTKFLNTLSTTKNHIILEVIDNIQGKIVKVTFESPVIWKQVNVPVGSNGVASINSTQYDKDDLEITYTDFITPHLSYEVDINSKNTDLKILKKSASKFSPKNIITEQRFSKSLDGTMIPYFIVYNKSIKLNGKNPTLLYGYGGFEQSLQPFYLGGIGKVWLEKGGVFVLANIRGGGEFGPSWHQAAVKEKHQVVFDDFISIAEDLINRKVTGPSHLGIQGGSNGGLLVAGAFIQRPDLFNAVLCEVPLLDMLRYHTLLAGSSWMDEYGNPDDPKMREVISKYSPYQNVKADVKYPEVFIYTSTKDDRVHPGHARKMVAKMKELGHPLFYYENTEGGHQGVANIEQNILKSALQYTYLWRKLK